MGCLSVRVGASLVLSAALFLVPGGFAAPAASAATVHGTLVPESASGGYPIILRTPHEVLSNGKSRPRRTAAVAQVGDTIVSGGNFLEIELPDGAIIEQPYFAAWGMDTKQMVCQQQFTFNKEVTAVEAGPTPTQVYVAGKFTKVSGSDGKLKSRNKVVLVDLSDCSVVKAFKSPKPKGLPQELAYGSGRLFIGGNFKAVGSNNIETVAEINSATGAVVPGFSFTTSGEYYPRVRMLEMNDAGTRLYLGGLFSGVSGPGGSITGPMAIIDISNAAAPTLTGHRLTNIPTPVYDVQDIGISPDRQHYALVYGTATSSDYVYYVSTAETSVNYLWRHFMRDSSYGVAVSDAAVYVGGHFCKPDAGPGATELMEPKLGFDSCTGARKYSGGVWRSHLAALDLADGTPLAWNPGQNSKVGAKSLEIVDRGLLVGSDGLWAGGRRTGTTTFFDFQ